MCPPLTTTASGPRAEIFSAASLPSSRVSILTPEIASASMAFGVTTVATGRSLPTRVSLASGLRSSAPLLAIMTGSTTTGKPYPSISPATASMIAEE